MRNKHDAKSSIVDVFASFLVLSYVKFLCVSLDLLIPTQIFNSLEENVGFYLYYDASLPYFGRDHCLYGVLAASHSHFHHESPSIVSAAALSHEVVPKVAWQLAGT